MEAAYLQTLRRRNRASETIRSYKDMIRLYQAALNPHTATTEEIEAWLDTRPIGPRTRFCYVSCLRGFHDWMQETGLREDNPADRLARPKLSKRLPRPIQTKDLEKAMRLAKPRMRLWLCLAAYQGLRVHEIAALKAENFRLEENPPTLALGVTKGDKDRALPLAPETIQALADFGMPVSGYLFPHKVAGGKPTGHPITGHWVTTRIAEYLRGHGIDATAHQLRHWFGTNVYRVTRDLRLTAHLLGHASVETSTGYVALVPSEQAVEAVRMIARREPAPDRGVDERVTLAPRPGADNDTSLLPQSAEGGAGGAA